MRIKLQKVVPDYIQIESQNSSQIWEQSLEFQKGEHVHIIAPSGSGKTSLIHFLYGLRKDYSGQIFYDDKEIKTFTKEEFASIRQNKLSVVFQDLRLFDDLSVKENIDIKRRLSPFHQEGKIKGMANRLGIGSKLDQQLVKCSYGEQQRVAIIRAMMQPFEFLLLDEPFSHLDDENRVKAMQLIKEECEQRGAGIIFADLQAVEIFKSETFFML